MANQSTLDKLREMRMSDKAQAVYNMIYGPVSPWCTASILQLHSDCFVVADEAALSLCPQ